MKLFKYQSPLLETFQAAVENGYAATEHVDGTLNGSFSGNKTVENDTDAW